MSLVRDVRYALREFPACARRRARDGGDHRHGVGATTTVLSVANTLLFKPPAGVRETGALVTAHAVSRDGSGFHSFSWPDWRDLQQFEGATSRTWRDTPGFPPASSPVTSPVLRNRARRVIELFPDAPDAAGARPLFHAPRKTRVRADRGSWC